MNKKEKFENFLESLKGNGQDNLIESLKKGFQVCMEANLNDMLGKIKEEWGEENLKNAIEKIGKKKFLQSKEKYIKKIAEHLNLWWEEEQPRREESYKKDKEEQNKKENKEREERVKKQKYEEEHPYGSPEELEKKAFEGRKKEEEEYNLKMKSKPKSKEPSIRSQTQPHV